MHALGPTVDGCGIGQQATRVDGGARGDPVRRRASGGEGQFSYGVRSVVLGEASGKRRGMGVADAVEGDHVDEFRRRGALRLDERGVGAGGSAHRLGGVVDQDVQRALRGDGVGERDHLGGVAQVDADDAQPVQPVGAVGHRGEAAHGVVREAGGDGGVGAVAEQSQRDVHADLGAATGEQRAPAGEVGAGVALGVAEGGALRAELVVERVDHGVVVSCRCSRRATGARCLRWRPTAVETRGRPAVSSSMRPGAPVAVAAMTAWSAAATASRLAWRRAFLTDLNMPAVARRTATASGCSGGKDSMSASTCRHVLSLSGSIAFTVEAYGLIHVRRSQAGAVMAVCGCLKAFLIGGLDPGCRPPQRAPGRAWRSVRFWNRLAACCEAR